MESSPFSCIEEQKKTLEGFGADQTSETQTLKETLEDFRFAKSGQHVSLLHEPWDEHKWHLDVKSVIGIISTKDIVIRIEPKINQTHFFRIVEAGYGGARCPFHRQPNNTQSTDQTDFLQLISQFFLDEVEYLTSKPLYRGYVDLELIGETWSGTLDVTHVVTTWFREGRFEPKVSTTAFSVDIPVNRLLRAALLAIADLPSEDYKELAKEATLLLRLFDGVGRLLPGDMYATVERRMVDYETAVDFAKQILEGFGPGFSVGSNTTWCFLIQTPKLIENGIREILIQQLPEFVSLPKLTVARPPPFLAKHDPKYKGKKVSFEPDLVFRYDGQLIGVGDVKYSIWTEGAPWNPRDHVEQAIMFAAATGSKDALIIKFGDRKPSTENTYFDFGLDNSMRVTVAIWPTSEPKADADADAAKKAFLEAKNAFLEQVKEWRPIKELVDRAQRTVTS